MKSFKYAVGLSAYLLIVWGFYRFLFQFPEPVEELFIKPVIWLLPVFYILKKERKGLDSLGITIKNFFPAIYYALGLGVLFAAEALVINLIKYGYQFNLGANISNLPFFTALGLSFATAISEEITFRGYIFTRFWKFMGNEIYANILTSLFWAIIHVPITIFSAFVYARTKNIVSPILLHVLWQWPIILFR